MVEIHKLSRIGKTSLGVSILQTIVIIGLQGAIAGVFLQKVDLSTRYVLFSSLTSQGYPVSPCNASVIPSSLPTTPPGYLANGTVYEAYYNAAQSNLVYLIIFILAQFFQLFLVIDALWQQNTIQIFMHCLFNTAMFGYSIFQYFQQHDLLVINCTTSFFFTVSFKPNQVITPTSQQDLFNEIVPLLASTIAVLGVFTIIFYILAFKLYLEFGWKIYKKIGADPNMRTMYRAYQIFIMLLKLDVFFFEAFAIQFLYLVLKPTDPEYALTIIAILCAIPILFAAVWTIQHENRYASVVWFFVMTGVIAYYIFKISRMYDPSQSYKYIGVNKFLTLFASLGLLVIVFTFINTIVCVKNYGLGLKEHLIASSGGDTGDKEAGRQRLELD